MVRIRTRVASTTVPELAPFLGRSIEIHVLDDAATGWPDGWFDRFVGSVSDPTFERALQPEADPIVSVADG